MQEALFYKRLEDDKVQCQLCPWNCVIHRNETGNCKVRTNNNGQLFTEVYNKVAALGSDPIEKKPLYHFHPGKNILSIGEVGCNLHCSFCQNHRLSQCLASQFSGFHNISSEQIVSEAIKTYNNIGIAYTYNEPFTFYEFLLDTAQLAHSEGLKNVIVSNGYINQKPLEELLPFIDAVNIDLKAFSESFYSLYTKGNLQAVLETLKVIAESKTHLEITNLLIPGINDQPGIFEKMVEWIASELGAHVPLHLSRYFPQYKFKLAPTPMETLLSLHGIARKHLSHVFLGNVSDVEKSSTYCTNCDELLIRRDHYQQEFVSLTPAGECKKCGTVSEIIL